MVTTRILGYAFHVKTVNNTRDVKILTNYLCTKKSYCNFPIQKHLGKLNFKAKMIFIKKEKSFFLAFRLRENNYKILLF